MHMACTKLTNDNILFDDNNELKSESTGKVHAQTKVVQ
jgi:hypothetical protein